MPATSPAPAKTAKPAKTTKPAPKRLEDKLARLGLRTDMDLVLHLPMRYEDETEIVAIRQAGFMSGSPAQVEGVVTSCEVQYRPRRQLVVTMEDASGPLAVSYTHLTLPTTERV